MRISKTLKIISTAAVAALSLGAVSANAALVTIDPAETLVAGSGINTVGPIFNDDNTDFSIESTSGNLISPNTLTSGFAGIPGLIAGNSTNSFTLSNDNGTPFSLLSGVFSNSSDNALTVNFEAIDINNSTLSGSFELAGGQAFTPQTFDFTSLLSNPVTQILFSDNDNSAFLQFHSATIDTMPQASEVPLPGAVGFMLTGIAGFAALRRKNSAPAAKV